MTELSDRVLKATTTYMGPASQRFLERQTLHHLNGLPFDKLEKKDLPELAKWVNVSGALIIDKEKARMLSELILTL